MSHEENEREKLEFLRAFAEKVPWVAEVAHRQLTCLRTHVRWRSAVRTSFQTYSRFFMCHKLQHGPDDLLLAQGTFEYPSHLHDLPRVSVRFFSVGRLGLAHTPSLIEWFLGLPQTGLITDDEKRLCWGKVTDPVRISVRNESSVSLSLSHEAVSVHDFPVCVTLGGLLEALRSKNGAHVLSLDSGVRIFSADGENFQDEREYLQQGLQSVLKGFLSHRRNVMPG